MDYLNIKNCELCNHTIFSVEDKRIDILNFNIKNYSDKELYFLYQLILNKKVLCRLCANECGLSNARCRDNVRLSVMVQDNVLDLIRNRLKKYDLSKADNDYKRKAHQASPRCEKCEFLVQLKNELRGYTNEMGLKILEGYIENCDVCIDTCKKENLNCDKWIHAKNYGLTELAKHKEDLRKKLGGVKYSQLQTSQSFGTF